MDMLLKPIIYICIIIIAALLKHFGVFKSGDGKTLSKIVMNFTLPAAIIISFSNYEENASLFFLILIGFFSALLPLLITFLFTKKKPVKDRVYYMISLGGLNIGIFAIPVISSFFGTYAVIICSMFDIGNAILMAGGSYVLTTFLLKQNVESEKNSPLFFIKTIGKRFFSSFPLDIYLLMLVFVLLDITIPSYIAKILTPIATANPFLSMFMIGLMFQFNLKKSFVKDIFRLVGLRLFFSLCAALLIYYVLPFSLITKQILTVLAFAPIGSLAPIFVEKAGGDISKSGSATTISIIISFFIMTLLSFIFLSG